MPWYTHPALDEIRKWDLSNKKVLEYGAGLSTIWWGHKAKHVTSVESNREWYDKIAALKPSNVSMHFKPVNEGDQENKNIYVEAYDPLIRYDIVVVDGILRYECIMEALKMERPVTLIVDNWQQDYVFICPAAEVALEGFEHTLYVQAEHTNHEGRPWTTAIFFLK